MNAVAETTTVMQSALQLSAEYGLPVFPCRPDKRPYTEHGFKDATTNLDTIEEWWRRWPDALIGVPTGKASGLFVLDVDPDGLAWYQEHAAELCAGRIHQTRRKGYHLLYKVPQQEIRCSAGQLSRGIDVRAGGGYAVWWPAHDGEAIGGIEDIGDAPAWLLKQLTNGASHRDRDHGDEDRDAGVHEGGRNDYLSREAYRLRKQGMSVEQIVIALRGLNEAKCRPPLDEDEVRTIAEGKERVQPEPDADQQTGGPPVTLSDFFAYMPQHCYIFVPSREMWPASSVNARIAPIDVGAEKPIKASSWLDQTRAVEQMTWAPGLPIVIQDKLVADGGWIERPGCRTFNLYRPPAPHVGNPNEAGPWLAHLERLYPDDAAHIIRWCAQRVQRPQEKLNHALVLGGAEGIGKDTILEPIKYAVGPWNFSEVNPAQLLGRFNPHVKSVILRLSEAHDLGDIDRYTLQERLKTLIAAPPDVLRCDEKNLREHSVVNVLGVIITTNHEDGLYIPGDSRRYYVAWSELTKEDYPPNYWQDIYYWYYREGGIGHVAAYLTALDLSDFDPKAPPPRTPAFWRTVNAGRAPEDGELADALETLNASLNPGCAEQDSPPAVTISRIAPFASDSFRLWLTDRRNSRLLPHRMSAAGYTAVPNKAAKDGLWKVDGRRQVIYARRDLAERERLMEADKLARGDRT